MSCKECLHKDVCNVRHFPSLFGLTGDGCSYFKNETKLLEIPDDDIIFTKGKWLVLNMESKDLGAAIKSVVDYSTKTQGGGKQ